MGRAINPSHPGRSLAFIFDEPEDHEAKAAYAHIDSGSHFGKVVVRVQ